jgi:hypothetical protein
MAKEYQPTIVRQVGELPNIAWTSTDYLSNGLLMISNILETVKELKHIANPASGPIRDSTFTLVCTGFNIPTPLEINGIELRVVGQRNGRIADEIIQLTYQDSAIGRNNFYYETDEEGRLPLSNDTIYGSPTDTWGVDITPSIVSDPSFGVILKFASHPYYPHSSGLLLNSITLTVY